MMASRPFKSLFRGAGRNALDLPVAGLAALAAAFAAFAVPQDLLARAVVATGLPTLLSAAQPPLGLTARVGLAVVGAVIVFGLVFLLLRLLDRSGLDGGEAGQDSPAAPRVRRRDGHPDAPAPRPISAARDLGEPAPPRAPRSVTPPWLDEAEPAGAALAAEPEPDPAPVPESWQAPEAAVLPEPVVEVSPAPAFAPAPEPEIAEAVQPGPVSAPTPAPAPAPAPAADLPSSLSELMARLEQGLAKRRPTAPAASATPTQVFPEPAAPEPRVFPEAADDRLQSAIASLQRLAARSS